MTSRSPSDSLVGIVLQDSFRLTGLIGKGGMGTVYEGTQLRLNKRVAIKLLSRDLSSNQEALARFHREAEVTSQLGHPHIVHVFDFGTAPSGEPYLVMEYLEGEDLDQRIRRAGRLRLPDVISIVKQIASALAATHARGIVHRDLKPANIFLLEVEGERDFVKIVDFGISKVRAASVRITGDSVVIGTPNYMSPEQATGQLEIDHKTDQWSLACIAYEMLSGRGPFIGDSVQSLLYQVVHQEPPALRSLVPGLPAEVESVIGRALAKRQSDRFATVNAFSRALTAATSGSGGAVVASDAPEPPSSPVVPAEAAATPPAPRPTTLSTTASEMLPFSRLRARMTPRGLAAFAGTAAAVVLIGALGLRARSGRSSGARALPTAGSRSFDVMPLLPAPPAAPPSRAAIEQLAPPAPVGAVPPPVDSFPDAAGTTTKLGAQRAGDTKRHKPKHAETKAAAVVPSREQPAAPSRPLPATSSPAKPVKRHLIEEL
jgi:eukaryotic-like serine/threonine-protein kinase